MACGSQGQAAAERRVPGLGGQEKEGLLQETEAEGKAQSHGDQGLAVAAASQQDKGPPCHLLDGGDSEKVLGSPKEGSRGSLQPLCHLRAWSSPNEGDSPGDIKSYKEY